MEEDAKGGQEQVQQEMQMVKDMLDELNGEKQELETEVSLYLVFKGPRSDSLKENRN